MQSTKEKIMGGGGGRQNWGLIKQRMVARQLPSEDIGILKWNSKLLIIDKITADYICRICLRNQHNV